MRHLPLLLAAAVAAAGFTLPGRARADAELRFAAGATPFAANCAVCHRATGAGTPGLAPPVTGYPPRFIATAAGRRQLVLTVLFGMYGEIVVDQRHYNFKMPDFARLDDATLAATLNYLVFDLGRAAADATPLTAAEVAAERAEVVGALPP